ncbi:hypothetical protein L0337_14705 [candidate division KSB1 bacterium]|nr:hypothetical protein [candidate division KSB1 bacterium]
MKKQENNSDDPTVKAFAVGFIHQLGTRRKVEIFCFSSEDSTQRNPSSAHFTPSLCNEETAASVY